MGIEPAQDHEVLRPTPSMNRVARTDSAAALERLHADDRKDEEDEADSIMIADTGSAPMDCTRVGMLGTRLSARRTQRGTRAAPSSCQT